MLLIIRFRNLGQNLIVDLKKKNPNTFCLNRSVSDCLSGKLEIMYRLYKCIFYTITPF